MLDARNFWRNPSRAGPLFSRNVHVVLKGDPGNGGSACRALSDISRVPGREPVFSLASSHLYPACFLCVRLPGRGPVILEAGESCCPFLRDAPQSPNGRRSTRWSKVAMIAANITEARDTTF